MPNFKQYVVDNFEDEIYKSLKNNFFNLEEEYFEIENIEQYEKNREVIDFFATCCFTTENGDEKRVIGRYEHDLHNKTLRFLEISDFNCLKSKNILNNKLVKYMAKEKLDEIATQFLSKYYPEAILNPKYVDPEIILKKMNIIKIEDESLDALGRIYFSGELYNDVKLKEDTIIINPFLNYEKSKYTINNSIIHECIHWEYHYKAIKLAKLCKKEMNNIESIEWQARTLTPKIQMPKKAFLRKTNELIEKHKSFIINYKDYMLCDILEDVIKDLSTFFKVSKFSIKIRLYELGFDDVLGTFIYIDDKYVPPHRYKKTNENITYSISTIDLAAKIFFDPILQELVKKGLVVYIDSHLMYNSPKCITKKDGILALTEYAKYHLDECAVPFILNLKNKQEHLTEKAFYFLNRDINTPFDFEIKFDGNLTKDEKNIILKETLENYANLYNSLSNDLTDSMKKCIKWAGKTQRKIAEEAGITEKAFGEIVNDKRTPDIKNICMICLAMGLPPMVSDYIIELSGNKLKVGKTEHLALKIALSTMYACPIEQTKEFLRQYGVTNI